MPGKKYLTEEKFEEWKSNDFQHVSETCFRISKKVARMEGVVWILVPLTIAILAMIVHILKNGI